LPRVDRRRRIFRKEIAVKRFVLTAVLATAAGLIAGGAAPAPVADAPFGCDARAPSVCYFRIYYQPRGTRAVVMPAGMKEKIPGVKIGSDRYCVSVGAPPAKKCSQKVINGDYNS
jgi:hypothetical protein